MAIAKVILSDPPWDYSNKRATRRDKRTGKIRGGIGVSHRYSKGTMKANDICSLGPLIEQVASPDAYLFQWVTCPKIIEGIEVMKAWGFRYVTVAFAWIKTYPNSNTPFYGPGRYTPSNLELVLLGIRGKCWHPNTGYKPNQEVRCPHPRDPITKKIIHSRKPSIVHEQIYTWLSPYIGEGRFLELFATEEKENWDCLGHAVTGRDIRDDLTLYHQKFA
jgi:N6-adenosine-specific RNA methylase IME4